jgi:hypothetical protein
VKAAVTGGLQGAPRCRPSERWLGQRPRACSSGEAGTSRHRPSLLLRSSAAPQLDVSFGHRSDAIASREPASRRCPDVARRRCNPAARQRPALMRTGASQWRGASQPAGQTAVCRRRLGGGCGRRPVAPQATTSSLRPSQRLCAPRRSGPSVRAISVASRLLGALRDVPSRC